MVRQEIKPLLGIVACLWGMGNIRVAISAEEVPFRLYRGYTIVVQGSIAGHPNLNFIIDTGAVPSVVDEGLVRVLHLAKDAERLWVFSEDLQTRRAVMPQIRLGPIQVESLPVLIADLSSIGRALGTRIDAMVGLDVLGQTNFSIDYELKRVVFGPVSETHPAVAFEDGGGFVVVRLLVNGKPFRMLLDTGANDLVLFENRIRRELQPITILSTKTVTNLGGEVLLKKACFSKVSLGSIDLKDQQASLMATTFQDSTGLDGLLGVSVLGVKRIEFDFDRRLLSLER